VRRLDEQTFVHACTEPASFRAATEPLDHSGEGELILELDPFAYVRIEAAP
jgi:hypothetical protein